MADSDILRGAIQAAAGNTLGLTQDQVLDLKRQQAREAQRENRGRRAERAGNQQSAEEFLREDTRRFESTGGYESEERYADPFGIPRSAADPVDAFGELSERGVTPGERQRGGYVNVDRGKGRERLWRERGQLVSEPKYARDKAPDMADPFVKLPNAPQATGIGGPNGLATQIADKVMRGEISETDLVPGSSNKTVGMLMQELAMEADPQVRLEADRAQAAKAIAGLTQEEIQQRAALEARQAASPQGENIRGVAGLGLIDSPYTDLTDEDVRMIREDAILRNVRGEAKPTSPKNPLAAELELIGEKAATPIIQERITRANAANPLAQVLTEERNAREASGYTASPEGRVNLGSIENIQSLGLASKKFNRGVPMDQFNVVQAVDPNTFTDATEMIGPDGQTVGYSDDTDKWVADVNLASPESATNAPTSRTATWMEGNLPGFGREGGTSFGARSVNPGDELGMLSQRLGSFAPATGIRGIDDLERAVRGVTVDAAFSGKTMWSFDQATGKKSPVQDPGLEEVLQGLDYTADEKVRLAAALQTVEAAQRSPVNRLQKDMYAAGLSPQGNAQVATGYEKDVQLARITNERVGRDNKKTGERRESVRKGLRALDGSPAGVFNGRDPSSLYGYTPYDMTDTDENGNVLFEYKKGDRALLPEAQQDLTDAVAAQGDSNKPFQAAPQGSVPERAQFLNRKAVGMTPDERIKAYGPEGGAIANRLEMVRDEMAVRRGNTTQIDSPRSSLMRQKDAEFGVAGADRVRADEARSRSVRGIPGVRGDGQAVMGSRGVEFVPDSIPYGSQSRTVKSQQATSAVSNPATDPTPLTVRGGWMGGGGSGRIVNPMASPEPEGRRIDDNIRNELAALNSGQTQGPRTPGIRQKIMNSIKRSPNNFVAAPRRQRYGAAAGAAALGLTGLSSLIGDESERREQGGQY